MESPPLLASLLAGMGLSVAGMALRWRSHRLEQQEKKRDEARPGEAAPVPFARPRTSAATPPG